jgi:hypothetical protein
MKAGGRHQAFGSVPFTVFVWTLLDKPRERPMVDVAHGRAGQLIEPEPWVRLLEIGFEHLAWHSRAHPPHQHPPKINKLF